MTKSPRKLKRFRSPDDVAPSAPDPLNLLRSPKSAFPAQEMSLKLARPILLASIGNPGPYMNTLHSAGHHLLEAVRAQFSFPPLSSLSLRPGRSSASSVDPNLVLWQSPSSMNVSGPAVAKAWKQYLQSLSQEDRTRAKLVVLHDELERGLGEIRVSDGSKSAKGHNGLKSMMGVMGREEGWTRIGVGIGRPSSRDPEDVSRYVLRDMTTSERMKIHGAAPRVAETLMTIGAEG